MGSSQRGIGLLLCTALVFTLCTVGTPHQPLAERRCNHTERDNLVRANTKFSLTLCRELLKQDPAKNVFFSPASISFALAMTYLGAGGTTAEQMKSSLNFDMVSEDVLHDCFSDLQDTLLRPDNQGVILHAANRLFGDKSFDISDAFLNRSQEFYKADLASVDFKENAEEAAQQINQWVEDTTHGKIRDLLAPGSVDAATAMVLVNAMYFKGEWKRTFDPAMTEPMEFHVSESEIIPVDMMYQYRTWWHGESVELNAQFVEMRYLDEAFSMFIILPAPGVVMSDVENNLTVDQLKTFRRRYQDVHVWLPKFKLEDSFSLADHLASLGIRDLFDGSRADLSGIAVHNNVFVDKVLHKAFIEVNEEGSEAAAATANDIVLGIEEPLEFKANRPFLFFIRENTTKSILFMGKVVRPQAAIVRDEL